MKIVIVIDIYDLLTNGTVMTAYRFVEELKAKGHSVRVVATGAKGEDCYEVPERYLPIVTEVARMQQIRFAKADVDVLTNAFDGADLIHFYLPFKLEKYGRKIAEKMDIPSTAAFHLQPENCSYNMGPFKYSKLLPLALYHFFKTRFYRHFDHIHCPSKFIADQLRKHGYKAQLHVISNGVDRDFVPLPEPRTQEADRFNILMIGRYASEKRQDVLIKAIGLSKYSDKIHLTLAGKGPKRKKLLRLAKRHLKNPITLGFYNKQELIDVIHSTDLYVHAADVEIEAIACIEAFACGVVPVIANSNKSATPQFALDERSLFKAGSPKDLAAKIDDWIEHPEEKREMSGKYVEQGKRYSIDYSITKAEEMFKEAVVSHRERKKLSTKEAKKQSKKFINRSGFFRFCSWLFYYIVATPLLWVYIRLGFALKVRGKKNLKKVKKTGAISVSNHVHLMDCAMNSTAMIPRKIIFTARPSNFDIPLAGKLLKLLGAMPTPENFSELRIFMNEVNRALKKHRIVHIYAEAHLINYYAGLREFERGAFRIACDSQVPILPIVISWRKSRGIWKPFRKKPCPTLTFGEPIYPDYILLKKEMEADLIRHTREQMQRMYDESNDGNSIDYFAGKERPDEYVIGQKKDKK